MKSRFAKATRTGSWSATSSANARSGSAGTTARKPAWRNVINGLGARKCARIRLAVMDMCRFATPTRRRPRSCSISSTSFATSAKPSITCARASREGKTRHQGAEIHAAVAQGEPDAGGTAGIEDFAASQQAPQHRLSAQGVLWPALELRARGLGAALLRKLARIAQVAAIEALRKVRRHD